MQTAVTTPTELLKIRLQLQTQLPGSPSYVGPIRLLKQVIMREGLTGRRPPCTSQSVRQSVIQSMLNPLHISQTIHPQLPCSTAKPEFHIGLWRGTTVTLVRDWPSFGVYFAVYEGMQEVLQPGSRASKQISPLALLAAGELKRF